MDDSIIVILSMALFFFSMFARVNKEVKKQNRKTREKNDKEVGEKDFRELIEEIIQSHPKPSASKSREETQTEDPRSMETLVPAKGYIRKVENKPNVSTANLSQAVNDKNNDLQNKVNDFDVKQAIIYSEILNPKFHEI